MIFNVFCFVFIDSSFSADNTRAVHSTDEFTFIAGKQKRSNPLRNSTILKSLWQILILFD